MRASWILFLAGRGSCEKTTFLFGKKTSIIVLSSFLLLVAKSMTQLSRRITRITIQEILRKFHSFKILTSHNGNKLQLVTFYEWLNNLSFLLGTQVASFSLYPSGHVFTHSPLSTRFKYKHALQSVGKGSPVEVLLQPDRKKNYYRIIIEAVKKKQRLSCGFVPY